MKSVLAAERSKKPGKFAMKLGIIGSGKVGRALGAWAANVGFAVAFTSRTNEHAVEAAQNAGHGARALDITALITESDLLY